MQNDDPNRKDEIGGIYPQTPSDPRFTVAERPSFKTEEVRGDIYKGGAPGASGEEQGPNVEITPQSPTPSIPANPLPSPQPPATSAPSGTVPATEFQSQVLVKRRSFLPKINIKKTIGIFLTLVLVVLGGILTFRFVSERGIPGAVKGGEIVWWGFQEDPRAVQVLIDEYQAKNPNVKVTYRKQSTEDYRERLTSSLASGKGPDIFEIHNSWVPMFIANLDEAPGSVISEAEFAQSYYPVIQSDLKKEKGIIGLPLYYDALTLYINQDIFASSAKEPPQTWNDLRDLVDPAKEGSLTIRGEDKAIVQSGVALGKTDNIDHWPEIVALMMLQNSVNLAKPEGKPVQDALSFYLLFDQPLGVWDVTLPPSTQAFARGRVAMYFGPTERAFDITQANPSLKYKTTKLPQLPKDRPEDPDVSYATYWFQGVSEKSANKGIAWDFLKFISSKESLVRLNEGRRGNGLFEKIYPRPDMAALQVNDPILGSAVSLAPSAKSWYLADKTFDGPNGINSQIRELFRKAIQAKDASPIGVTNLATGIAEVLAQYGIAVK